MRRYQDVDEVAKSLARLGAFARNLPPMWRGSITLPCVGPNGLSIGTIIPGHGLALDLDVGRLGIRRKIPHVLDRSTVLRTLDLLLDDRGQFTSMLSFKTAVPSYAQVLPFQKNNDTAVTAAWKDVYLQAGSPGAGTYTAFGSGGSAKDNTDVGSLIFGARDPVGSNTAYFTAFTCAVTGTAPIGFGTFLLVDMLIGYGAFDTNTTSTQTIGGTPAALTRYTSGAGVLIAAICDSGTNVGGTGSTATISYTNQAGTSGQTATGLYSGGGVFENYLLWSDISAGGPLTASLATGDYGVRSVQSLTFSAGAGTAGATVALVLYRPLAMLIGGGSNIAVDQDVGRKPSLITPLATTSGGKLGCLGLFMLPAPGAGAIQGEISLCEG